VNKDSYAKKKQVAAFIDYYVEQDQTISEAAKFITLNDEQRAELTGALDTLKG
jgi:phosphate transport system substrate-binding protein